MDVKKLALMIGALIVAAVCAVMARSLLAGSSEPQAAVAAPPAETGPEVLVATRPLPPGTIITPDALRYQPWPKDLVEQAYYLRSTQGAATLNGTVVRYAITAGQPVTQGALVKPGDRGFLAAALQPGMRAVTVPVSAQTGVAGFVFPGDHVDLVLTQTVVGGGDGQPLKVSETIVRNLRVLATDQRTDKTSDDQGKTEVTTFSNVTLETTPKLSEKIAVAQTIGALSLSLRPLADSNAELESAIAAGEVDAPKDARQERALRTALASRPADTDTTYATGADVSRFQRRSVPGTAAQGQPAPAPQFAMAAAGPAVRVARGNNVVSVPVGGK